MDPQIVELPAQVSAPPQAPERPSTLGVVGDTVHEHIRRLQSGYRRDRPDAVGALARIRRGAGKPAGALPDLWGLTGTEGLHEAHWEKEEQLTHAENAVHIAVTLWALHQQSHREADMHVRGPQFGAAVRRLMTDGDIDEPIRKRFVRAGTASSLDALAQRLRDIVLLLRRDGIPLDYGLLAEQIYRWQQPQGPAQVHRAWGRSFHTYRPRSTTKAAAGTG